MSKSCIFNCNFHFHFFRWPVAYHGTLEVNVLDILRDGFDLNKCVRFAYGKGIYCTPQPHVALGYGHEYIFSAPDGKVNKLI